MNRSGYATLACYLLALATFLLDQYVKLSVETAIALGGTVPLLDGFFHLTHVRNMGSAFSLFWGKSLFLSVVTSLIVLGLLVYQWRSRSEDPLMVFGIGFLLGGAVGNLVDRLCLGFVRDMFDFRFQGHNVWPIFNIADIAVLLGIGLLMLSRSPKETKETKEIKKTEEP
ncbi:MAG: signal peptidase II [Bacteroidota bacterium]